jgi:hypothetical protein
MIAAERERERERERESEREGALLKTRDPLILSNCYGRHAENDRVHGDDAEMFVFLIRKKHTQHTQ